ncbi:hypothetical protein Tco_0816203, partial [Tanacetum coccineum]
MEIEHELGYETLTRVYLGSYEHYKGVGAEVEHSKPGFDLQGSKMEEMGRIHFLDFFNDPRIIREQRIAAYKGYRGGGVVQVRMSYLRLCDGGEPRQLWLDEEVSGDSWIRMMASAETGRRWDIHS